MAISKEQILAQLSHLPRVSLAKTPTPLERMSRLERVLKDCFGESPQLLVKREDTTGLAFGGNKARHFEFIMGEVVNGGYTSLITVNHYHSNQARLSVAAAAKQGLPIFLISTHELDKPITGNLLLCKLLGAKIHRVPTEYVDATVAKLKLQVEQEGGKAFTVAEQAITRYAGALAFLEAGAEIEDQTQTLGVGNKIVLWGLVGPSFGGLALYAKARDLPWKFMAVPYAPASFFGLPGSKDGKAMPVNVQFSTRIAQSTNHAAARIGLDARLQPADLPVVFYRNCHPYGEVTDDVLNAVFTVARSEGLILDTNYTGRLMAALIAAVKQGGMLSSAEAVIFIHSGGTPQNFAFTQQIWERHKINRYR